MKKILWISLVVLAGIAALGILAQQDAVKVKDLSPYAQVAVKGNLSLVADYEVARLRGEMKYIPLRVYLGIQGKGRIFAERSFFTLTDPKGAKQAMATVEQVAADYGPNYISMDYDYYRLNSTMDYASHFNACQRLLQVAFFPNPSGPQVLFDQVELPAFSFFNALIYFPNPAGPDPGGYTLSWNDPKSKNALDVPFKIDWQKEKPKKGK